VANDFRDTSGVDSERCQFKCVDFFQMKEPMADLIFDHTFLCAILPVQRPQWASQMAALLNSGGLLICYMFPLNNHEDGPPWALSVEIYRDLLSDAFELVLQRELEPIEKFQKRLESEHKEMVSVWKRK
jgi:hypothetical protein